MYKPEVDMYYSGSNRMYVAILALRGNKNLAYPGFLCECDTLRVISSCRMRDNSSSFNSGSSYKEFEICIGVVVHLFVQGLLASLSLLAVPLN